jgi:peptidoglycan/xylan/chitin deacetylase (PgdA/CDA1 family)
MARTHRRALSGLGLAALLVVCFGLTACATPSQAANGGRAEALTTASASAPTIVEISPTLTAPATATVSPSATATPAPTLTATPAATPTPDLASVKPNELGLVPIYVYHLFGDKETPYMRTPANFRKDLERFYANGYRTIKLSDYLDGEIDLPAGASPMVLTFDDSSPNQFRLVERNGKLVVDPNCALGILESFAEKHPDFGHNSTFYILPAADPPHNLFGQDEYQKQKLDYLLAGGYELGNHTLWHQNLGAVGDAEVQRQIGQAVEWIRGIAPSARLDTIALVQGAWPKSKQLAITGSYKGETYRHRAVMMAWGEPAYPFDHVKFNAYAIPRVQGVQQMLDLYIRMLDASPEMRYVSDGNSRTLTFPTEQKTNYDPRKGATEIASAIPGYTTIQLRERAIPTAPAATRR